MNRIKITDLSYIKCISKEKSQEVKAHPKAFISSPVFTGESSNAQNIYIEIKSSM